MKKLVWVTFLVGFLFSQETIFIGDQGFGARAKGMGNAFTAVSDDATAIAWNPAGLTNLFSTEISINGQYRSGSYTYEIEKSKDDLTAEKSSNFELNFLSAVHPIKFDFATLVFGIAHRSLYNWNDEVKLMRNDDVVQHHVSEGGIKAFTLSTGVQLLNFAAVGVSFNKLSGELESYNGLNDNKIGTTTEYSGSFIDVGAQLKFTEAFKLGYKVSLPFERTEDSEYGIPLFGNINSDSKVLDIPRLETFGVAFQFSDNSTLSFDYKRHPWSETTATVEKRNGVEPNNTHENNLYKYDLNSIHFGYESLNVNSNNSSTSWRFGFFTKPYQEEDHEGNQIVNPVITGGYGLSTDALAFDISAQFELHNTEISETAVYKGATFFLNTTLIFYL